ncbi:tRNA (adenosine(37)-N6)-threonylcarbamoyltransferase complex dimerization subunit type 1 TsaB [Candidatus Microgenomates bacterium]|nr:tRNA (adenosine(37)-N6)-threonylcarbamoyltransferase complex dimerization subunit type 1 TsaB [Candidatus Microgenomates bacterium]
MKLFIDTSDSERIIVGVDGEKQATDAKVQKAQMLLLVIDKLLRKKKLEIKDIEEIQVNTGPGSFTGLRVGISVANTLGWALGVRVNGKEVKKSLIEPVYQ